MAKPTTKKDLIDAANAQFEKLFTLIATLKASEQAAAFCFHPDLMAQKDGAAHWQRDRDLKDVLIHLYEWHQLLLNWENANANGQSRPFLPSPYTWKSYGEMNIAFWNKHQATTLETAKQLLSDSHAQVLSLIARYSDEQLFTKKYFPWTGTSSLGQYCISTTASHYDWAIKKLKVQIKALRG